MNSPHLVYAVNKVSASSSACFPGIEWNILSIVMYKNFTLIDKKQTSKPTANAICINHNSAEEFLFLFKIYFQTR